MPSSKTVLTSSIGQKWIMGLTGLFLVSFLFVHMSGNFLLFKNDGGIAFNEYTKFMTTNPVIRILEWVLFGGFIAHIIYAIVLSVQNNKARPTKYAYSKGGDKASSWFSRNMGLTGSIFFVYLVVHLAMFWGYYKFGGGIEGIAVERAYTESWKLKDSYGPFLDPVRNDEVTIEKGSYLDEDLYELMKANGVNSVKALSMTEVVKASFGKWYIVVFYVIAMVMLAFHLSHGFQSAFRTLGFVHGKYTPAITLVGKAIAIAIPLAFAAMPIYYYIAFEL